MRIIENLIQNFGNDDGGIGFSNLGLEDWLDSLDVEKASSCNEDNALKIFEAMSSEGYRLAVLSACDKVRDYDIKIRGGSKELDNIVGGRYGFEGESVRNRRWRNFRRDSYAWWEVRGDKFAI